MEEFTLVEDLAIIMATAGAVMFLFRYLRLSPIFGYLVAGLLIGPYTFSHPLVENIDEVRLLADIGLVLLVFGLGLEFSWSRIQQVGLTVLLIAGAEVVTMIYLGYWVGNLLGWETWDSIFLGAALCITSSAIAFSILKEQGKLDLFSSKLIIGISVAEDFVAIAIIAILTGIARTGTTDLAIVDVGYVFLKLLVYVAALIGFGTLIVPRIIKIANRLRSKESMVVVCLGLCFGAALISREIGISGVAGAFLMGSLLGHTDESEEIADVISPIRYMFGALYFVAIGMLIDVAHPEDYIIPIIVVTVFFIVGKVLGNMLLTFISGHSPKTALEVGMAMPQMGEFSLAIAKVGKQYKIVESPLYPAIALSSAVVSLISPHLIRLTDPFASKIERCSPDILKTYVFRLSNWLQTLRGSLIFESEASQRAKRSVKIIIINGLIVMAIVGVGSFILPHVDVNYLEDIRPDIVGLVASLVMLSLCIPSFIAIWRSVRTLDDSVVELLMTNRGLVKGSRPNTIRIVLRDSIMIVLVIFATIWSFPLISELLSLGSISLIIPVILLAFALFLVLRSIRQIHGKLEQSFSHTGIIG